MNGRVRFLTVFLFIAFVMKAVGEFVHEVGGHGFFVLLFGGEITRVYVSLLWPYELSSIGWNGNFETWQLPFIYGGGLLVCLIVSWMIQTLLFLRIVRDWPLSSFLFWLSFWTLLNPVGYLILGGISPFGDVAALIAEGVLTQASSLAIGLIIFLVAFFSLSKIFRDLLLSVGIIKDYRGLRFSLGFFWLIVPLVTATALIGLRQPLFYLPVSFIPSLLALIIPSIPPLSIRQNDADAKIA